MSAWPRRCAGDVALVVIAVSTAGVPWAAEQLAAALAGRAPPILLVTKGLAAADGEIRVLPALVEDALRARRRAHSGVGGIGGPCLALELAARRETAAVIAHPDPAVLPGLIDLVSAPYYHVRPSTDVVGVEACAALKNLVVMAVGAVMGQLEVVGEAAERGAHAQCRRRRVQPGAGRARAPGACARAGGSRRCWAWPARAICS